LRTIDDRSGHRADHRQRDGGGDWQWRRLRYKGRDFAAWLGLVPKQMSTGDRTILGRITKRGNRYLRMLFIQGARAILLHPSSWAKHSFGPWLTAAAKRLHHNVLTVALANKLARIALTVWWRDATTKRASRR